MRSRKFAVLTSAWMLCGVTGLYAQLNRAIVEGVVTDPQGAAVAGVNVVITNLDTNVTASSKTNSTGYYRLVDLVPGKYDLCFDSPGFNATDVKNIDVRAGETVRIDGNLKIGSTQQTVEVTAEAALLETSASNFSHSIGSHTIQEVPLHGRDLQQLVYLLPGVSNAAGPPGSNFGFNSQFGTFPDPTYVQGSDVSVNGGQAGANAWYLDGNLNLAGISENVAVNPSPDSVSEFQGITNAFAAEYGRMAAVCSTSHPTSQFPPASLFCALVKQLAQAHVSAESRLPRSAIRSAAEVAGSPFQ